MDALAKLCQEITKIIKTAIQFLVLYVLIFSLTGCGIGKIASNLEPLPAVAPLPLPQLPNWIEEISPTGEAKELAQIRIRFKSPLIPLESLDSSEEKEILEKFEVIPPLDGHFRFLTPRMIGFQADRPLPKATRLRVTLKTGLADLEKHRLEKDLAWTFNTETLQLSNLPGNNGSAETKIAPVDTKPQLQFTSNVELDLNHLNNLISLIPEGKQEKQEGIKLTVTPVKSESDPDRLQTEFNASESSWTYNLNLDRSLNKASRYRLQFSPGLRPLRGNLPSEKAFSREIQTYAPLAFQKLELYGQPDSGGAYGRFVEGSPQLMFNNGLVADSVLKNISIQPAAKKSPLVRAYDGDNFVSFNPWVLQPNTNYTITLGKGLKDKFGQTLDQPFTLKYRTGDLAADLWAPTGLHIFPSTSNLQLNLSGVNLPDSSYQAAYRVVKPTDLVYYSDAYPSSGTDLGLLPATDNWSSFPFKNTKNKTTEIAIPVSEKLGATTGMLAYGVQAKTNDYQQDGQKNWAKPSFSGLVQLTNLGVFSQWFPNSGLVRVNHLDDGSAVENAQIEIYRSNLSAKVKSTPQPCAIGNTDRTGTLLVTEANWQSCLQGYNSEFGGGPELLVIARENQDWAFTRTYSFSGSYDYGIEAEWDDGKPISRGIIFSDRQLYQPGETAWFTAAAYYLQNGKLQQDNNIVYEVSLEYPDGKITNLGNYTTNQFGTFSLELLLKQDLSLGNYVLKAKSAKGVEITGDFRLAEFKPPNFKVDLDLGEDAESEEKSDSQAVSEKFATTNQEITANVASSYLFGAPVGGGKVKYYVTRSKTDFIPSGWEKFSFGRQWFWPEESPQIETSVFQGDRVLDLQGKNQEKIKVTADLPFIMRYQVDAEVTDVSNLSVANSQNFIALPSDRLIGLKNDFVADAGKNFSIEVIVSDPHGKAIEGEKVKIELQQSKYSSVTEVVEGSLEARNQVEYQTVATTEINSQATPLSVSLTAKESGSYRIRANLANAKDEATATDTQIWVTGGEAVDWGERYDNNRLDIRLDKDTYTPGETATALIQSPYPEAELYFAVIRDRTLFSKIIKVKGGAPQIQFTITPDMVPNAAVEAVLIRQGKSIATNQPGETEKLAKVGFTPLQTSLEDKYLKIEATLTTASLEPGKEQTIQLQIKDDSNNPVSGQIAVMVVNEAILQLTGYRPPDLVKTVFATQPIATRFADNRPDVVLDQLSSPLAKGWGFGGGFSTAAANTRIRSEFKPIAYYNGSVLTDNQGKATVSFKLPDDLTTWRVMTVATDGNWHFGNGDATFITTKPLISNPVLPQFLRPGDRFAAGLSVTNTTKEKGNVNITASATGTVQFAQQSPIKQNLTTTAEPGTNLYRFPMLAKTNGEAQVQFSTQMKQQNDAFSVPLTVKPLAITEQVVETGTTQDRVRIPLNVSKNVVPNLGGLEISLASTLIPEISTPAKQVQQETDLPFLETAASQLSIAANLQQLQQQFPTSLSEFNPTQQAAIAIESLAKLQLDDGGFGTFPGNKQSNPFLSPYVAQSIAQAQTAKIQIDDRMVSRLRTYLDKLLANPGQYDYCKSSQCKNQVRLDTLIALADLGDRRNDFLASLYEQKNQFDRVNQTKLARYLFTFPEWRQEANTLFNQLQSTVNETGRSATINLPSGWGWLNSHTTAQAETLRLFIAANSSPERIDRVLQGLLNSRRNGSWGDSYDNAQALQALVAYMKLQPTPANFIASAQLGRKQLAKVKFQGYSNPSLSFQIPSQDLPIGKNELILQKSGQGKLHYLAAYNYALQGNQPGLFQGLRVTREIRLANQEQLIKRFGLYDKDEPLKLLPGQVFDVSLEIISDRNVDRVLITDFLPGGLEAVDSSFQTATQYFQTQGDSWQINYQQIKRDRILAYADRLDAGVYQLHYLVRSVTPGTFFWPGAEAKLQYEPEQFGRCAASSLEIAESNN